MDKQEYRKACEEAHLRHVHGVEKAQLDIVERLGAQTRETIRLLGVLHKFRMWVNDQFEDPTCYTIDDKLSILGHQLQAYRSSKLLE